MARSICNVEDCERFVNAKGLCGMHYRRWQRHGTTERTKEFYGPIKNKYGYVLIWCPEHPAAYRPTNRLPEHRLVMETMLGRYLLPGENVHHKNGVRDDNRPENLELWITQQPKGQRVEDMVAWAHEIIERYEK